MGFQIKTTDSEILLQDKDILTVFDGHPKIMLKKGTKSKLKIAVKDSNAEERYLDFSNDQSSNNYLTVNQWNEFQIIQSIEPQEGDGLDKYKIIVTLNGNEIINSYNISPKEK